MGHGFSISEMAKIGGKYVGKWLNYLTNRLKMWKLTQRFWKYRNISEMAQKHGARLKYLRNDFTMLEMA